MKQYELLVILKPDLTEAAFGRDLEDLKTHLAGEGAVFGEEEIWGKRRLAYKIKKWTEGYYAFIKFQSSPENLKKIRKALPLNKKVIRHLVIGVEK